MSTGHPLPPGAEAARDAANLSYREFLRRKPNTNDAFYAEESLRFELRETDVLAVPEDARVEEGRLGVLVASERSGVRVEIEGVPIAEARRIVSSIDGRRTLGTLRASFPGLALDSFVSSTFGKILFAPFAVMDLESRLSGADIVRYPGSPYEVVRSYWENMIAVEAAIETGIDAVSAAGPFTEFLQALHRKALLGEGEKNFYRPASPIVGKRGVVPGAFLDEPTLLDETGPEIRFVSGIRIGASSIGGSRFQDLLAEFTRDPASRLGDRRFVENGTAWGRVVTARADEDAGAAPWFCPPRPITSAHWEKIRRALISALDGARRNAQAEVVRFIAVFHQSFLRLHPFASGNQSVAMSLVNHVLRRACGAGIPHLVLDHLAFRLSEDAYARVFSTAVDEWLVKERSPAARARLLIEKKRAVFAFLRDLALCRSHEEARSLTETEPQAARLSLIPLPR